MTIAALSLAITVLVLAVAWRTRPAPERIVSLRSRPRATASRLRPAGATARVVAVVGLLVALGPFVAAAGLIAAIAAPKWNDMRRQRAAANRVRAAFPDFVDLLVITVKSGCSPPAAVECVMGVIDPAIAEALSAVTTRLRRGDVFADAIAELPRQLGPIAQALADSLALTGRYGTPLLPILDRLSAEARADRRRNAEAAARRLPITLSFPLVGCTLPSFVLVTIVPLFAGTISSLRSLAP